MKDLIIVRGGGDIATGTIYKLYKCGFKVLILEIPNPSAIRRNVAFSEAVYQGSQTVEDVTCVLSGNIDEAMNLLNTGKLVMLVDPKGDCIEQLKPMAVVDAILAKENLGTHKGMAGITVALGPGFEAGRDVDAVIETMRGHSLGRVIYQGMAIKNTGVPGMIGGFAKERVIHSPAEGILKNVKHITDVVKSGDVIAVIENGEEKIPVKTGIDGILRGLIRDGYPGTKGLKLPMWTQVCRNMIIVLPFRIKRDVLPAVPWRPLCIWEEEQKNDHSRCRSWRKNIIDQTICGGLS